MHRCRVAANMTMRYVVMIKHQCLYRSMQSFFLLHIQTMAMRSETRVEAEVEEEENFGPQPLSRLEVCVMTAKTNVQIFLFQ